LNIATEYFSLFLFLRLVEVEVTNSCFFNGELVKGLS